MDGTSEGLVDRAHAAAAIGDWSQAFGLFTQADAQGLLDLGDLPPFADVAYAAGELDMTIRTWERAHAVFLEADDRVMAAGAAVRVAMHLLFDTALMAPVRGWLARADRLLGDDPSPAQAWFAVVRNYERVLSGDVEGARHWARRAVEIGAQCDPAAAAVGGVAEARLLILDGEVEVGLAMLDEAGATVMAGTLDPLTTGVVYCELVCALQGLAQYDRAEQWTEAMERWSRTNAIGSIHGRCRVHRAEILRLRGHCDEAETQALAACDELRPYLRRELGWPLSELGRIRLNRGDLEGAEAALLDVQHLGWQAHPALAVVWRGRGDSASAVSALRDALEQPSFVPSKEQPPNTPLWRAPLLAAHVDAEVEAGELERARTSAEELSNIAARYGSTALRASASAATGRVHLAGGDVAAAASAFADALRLWNEVRAPYEAANAQIALADAYSAGGNDDRAMRERSAAQATLDGIAAGPAQHRPATSHTANATFRREGDVWSIEFAGQVVRVRDARGLRHLSRLLSDPAREFHVLDLVAAESGGAVARPLGDAGPLLDEQAKAAYRRRLEEIDADIDDSRAAGDAVREAQAEHERSFLLSELSRAVGLGGRDRRASSASERARVAVTRAVRQAIARIAEHHATLGEHLKHSIRTGTYCAYEPDPRAPITWRS
ncbi:MAG: transcriptional regulator [Acidimicrobiales bacterium]